MHRTCSLVFTSFQKYGIWTLGLVPADTQNQMAWTQGQKNVIGASQAVCLNCLRRLRIISAHNNCRCQKPFGLSLYIHFSHVSTGCHGFFCPKAFKQSALYSWIASCLLSHFSMVVSFFRGLALDSQGSSFCLTTNFPSTSLSLPLFSSHS